VKRRRIPPTTNRGLRAYLSKHARLKRTLPTTGRRLVRESLGYFDPPARTGRRDPANEGPLSPPRGIFRRRAG